MKILITFILLPSLLMAQPDSRPDGLYLSADSLRAGQLLYQISAGGTVQKIKLNGLFTKERITVVLKDTVLQLATQQVFAFRTSSGSFYRIYGGSYFQLFNPHDSIVIYKLVPSQSSPGRTNVTSYYFSRGLDKGLYRLTFKNINAVFSDKPDFLKSVSRAGKYNTDLALSDPITHKFRLNELFLQFMKAVKVP